jgi:hypothetical protein
LWDCGVDGDSEVPEGFLRSGIGIEWKAWGLLEFGGDTWIGEDQLLDVLGKSSCGDFEVVWMLVGEDGWEDSIDCDDGKFGACLGSEEAKEEQPDPSRRGYERSHVEVARLV